MTEPGRKVCATCSGEFAPELVRCPLDGAILELEARAASPGDILGNFRIVRVIGQGGAGMVYEAEHVRLGRRVAIKVLHRDSATEETITRFFNEARAVNEIKHPNIIDIEDCVSTPDGLHYLVMELLSGIDLRDTLGLEGKLAPARVAAIGEQVASALAAVHRVDIVHRDLKPDNIFLVQHHDGRETVKLLDFGIAKFLDQQGVTRTGMTVGTPTYMAPEQITKGTEVETRSDLYALGIVMYEALVGTPPFDGPTTAQILRDHCLEPVEPPSQRRGEPLPEVLEAVVLKCLEKQPHDRFTTGDEMVAALRADRPVITSNAWRERDRRQARRRRALWMMPAFAMVLAAAIIQIWPRSEPRAETIATPRVPRVPATPERPEPPRAPAPPPPPAPAPVRTIALTLRARPGTAEVFLGERSLGKTPGTAQIPRDDHAVQLTARFADGTTVTETLVPDRTRATLEFVKPRRRPATGGAHGPTNPSSSTINREGTLDPFKKR